MIYELSEEHKNCVLLNFAIQAISEAGHQAEITGIATASKYVDVFSRVLVDSVSQLINEQDETALATKLPEFTVCLTCFNFYISNLFNLVFFFFFFWISTENVCPRAAHLPLRPSPPPQALKGTQRLYDAAVEPRARARRAAPVPFLSLFFVNSVLSKVIKLFFFSFLFFSCFFFKWKGGQEH